MNKALITGASTGIGLEFARQLKNQGWEVWGIARSEDKLKELFGDNYIAADLITEDGISATIKLIEKEKFNLLINNAGFGAYGKFLDISIDKQVQIMQLNMDALVKLSYAYLKIATKGDALINVSSALSLLPMPGGSVYSATKSFVTAFTECLWYEFKNTGIRILATLPGPVATPFHEVAGGSTESMDPKMVQTPKEVVEEALKKLLLGKSPSVVNGNMFKLFTKFGQILPRKKRLEIMSQNGPINL